MTRSSRSRSSFSTLLGGCWVHNKLDAEWVAKWLSQIRDITRNLPRAAAPVGPSSTPALQSLTEFEQDIYSRSTPSGHDESPLRIVDRSDEPRDHESIRQRVTSKSAGAPNKRRTGSRVGLPVRVHGRRIIPGTSKLDTRLVTWLHGTSSGRRLRDRQVAAAYPVDSKDAVLVPYPRRAEALCHAELEYCRVRSRAALPRPARGVVRGVGGSGRRCHSEMDREDGEEFVWNGLLYFDLTDVKMYG